MFTSFNTFGSADNPQRERRFVYADGFSRFEDIVESRVSGSESSERKSYIDIRAERLNGAKKKADEVATNSVDKAFGDRMFAPIVDEDHAKALAKLSFEKFMEGNTENPQLRGALEKAYAMVAGYPGDGNIVQGLQFGLEGTNLVVLNMDPDYLKWALNDVDSQIKFQRENKKPNMDIPRHKRETDEEYGKRVALIRKHASTSAQYNAEYRGKQVEQWEQVRGALIRYNSDYEKSRVVAEQVEQDPKKVNQLSEAWIKRYPAMYRKLVTNAAKVDPNILEGKEKYLVGMDPSPDAQGMYKFYRMLESTWEANPAALKFYPERLKVKDVAKIPSADGTFEIEVSAAHYRKLMIDNVAKDTSLLSHAISEFDKHWKDAPEDIKSLGINAINEEPSLFWHTVSSLGDGEMFQQVYDGLNPLVQAKVIGEITTLKQIQYIDLAHEGGWSTVVAELANTNDEALYQIAKNKSVMRFIKDTDNEAYEAIRARVFADTQEPEPSEGEPPSKNFQIELLNLRDQSYFGEDIIATSSVHFRELILDNYESHRDLIQWNEQNFAKAMTVVRNNTPALKNLLKDAEFRAIARKKPDLVPKELIDAIEKE